MRSINFLVDIGVVVFVVVVTKETEGRGNLLGVLDVDSFSRYNLVSLALRRTGVAGLTLKNF